MRIHRLFRAINRMITLVPSPFRPLVITPFTDLAIPCRGTAAWCALNSLNAARVLVAGACTAEQLATYKIGWNIRDTAT